jgi:ribosomal protein S18 acetylase RimI-like enzyme
MFESALAAVDPHDPGMADRIVEIQRAAYAVEAELIGFDGIPPLHENADDVRRLDDLTWLGSHDGDVLVAVIAWTTTDQDVDIDRLAVHPDWVRQGRGQQLVEAALGLTSAGSATITVSTGARNHPACLLYRSLGFVPVERRQIAPGVFVYQFELRLPGG